MHENTNFFEEIKAMILDKIAALELTGFWRPMYGGLVFELEDAVHKTQIGGVFISKKHVSFEFSKGYLFDDPNGLLEGGGKFRRHLKLRSFNDIGDKNLTGFFKQAYKLQQSQQE
ncbi:MAG: hypothetical protein COB24_08185 [Hyphomicrobiales bacterium]|nr:MAG: hypothetical protein COB24_08185 [Hyphomicrobiales bacterium]